jgi:hypothetical protein
MVENGQEAVVVDFNVDIIRVCVRETTELLNTKLRGAGAAARARF